MKAKKPILLAALVLTLLAVALIAPAVASGKPDALNPNQALNWVSHGENSNGTYHHDVFVDNPFPPPEQIEVWLQAGHSVLVKQMSDGTLVGNGVFHMLMKPLVDKWLTIHTKDVYADEVVPVFQNDVTYQSYLYTASGGSFGVEIDHAKVATFYMDFGAVGLMKLVLVDGGEPKTCDYEETWVAFADPITGVIPDLAWWGENVAFGNIQIHYGGEPIIE